MKEWAESFYSSVAWKKCRKAYAKSKQNLCEQCLEQGIIKQGEIVHHKVHLNPVNILDPDVSLNWDNLKLVCRDCHGKEHGRIKRYQIDEDGTIKIK